MEGRRVDGELLLSQMDSLGSEILACISLEMLLKILAPRHPRGRKGKDFLPLLQGWGGEQWSGNRRYQASCTGQVLYQGYRVEFSLDPWWWGGDGIFISIFFWQWNWSRAKEWVKGQMSGALHPRLHDSNPASLFQGARLDPLPC